MQNNIDEYKEKKLWNLTVVGLDPKYIGKTYNANKWIFQCDCGNTFSASPSRVLSGHKKSCGCRKKTVRSTHGAGKDPFYITWWGMMRRCYHKENQNYNRYGGRGIKVCEEWHNPAVFVEWARATSGGKEDGISLDRIDNNKGYCPKNCKWSTRRQQSNNRRNTLVVKYNGETIPLSDLAREHNVNLGLLRARIFELGWDVEDALTVPKRGIRKDRPPKKPSANPPKKGLVIDGETRTVTDWCKVFGTNRDLALQRISRGWDPVEAVKTPKKTEWSKGRKPKTEKS